MATLAVLAVAACSSIDCPLNNRVYASYKLGGDVASLPCTLTVSTTRTSADGNDTVLLNQATGIDSFALPLSYNHAEDVLFFSFAESDTTEAIVDTVRVAKADEPHFEAVDCNPTFFHTLTAVGYTRHAIDSLVINNPRVTYNDSKPHFLLYLKGNDD